MLTQTEETLIVRASLAAEDGGMTRADQTALVELARKLARQNSGLVKSMAALGKGTPDEHDAADTVDLGEIAALIGTVGRATGRPRIIAVAAAVELLDTLKDGIMSIFEAQGDDA